MRFPEKVMEGRQRFLYKEYSDSTRKLKTAWRRARAHVTCFAKATQRLPAFVFRHNGDVASRFSKKVNT